MGKNVVPKINKQKRLVLVDAAIALGIVAYCYWDLKGLVDFLGFGKGFVGFLCVLSFAGGFFVRKAVKWFIALGCTTVKAIILVFVSLYFSFSLTATENLRGNARYNLFTHDLAINILTTMIWVMPTLLSFLYLYSLINVVEDNNKPKNRKKVLTIIGIAMLLEMILLLIALNPAITAKMSYNSVYYAKKLGEIGILDWISPFYYILLHCLISIIDSVTFVVSLQYSAYILAMLFLTDFFIKKKIKLKWIVLLHLYCVTNLSFQIYMVTVMPDSIYIVCFIWLFYLLLRIVDEKAINIKQITAFTILLILIGLLRQNGIVIAACMSVVLMTMFLRKSKFIVLLPAVVIGVIFLVKGPVYDFINVERAPHQKFLAMTNDILNSYYAGQELSDDVSDLVNKVTYDNPDAYEYTQFKADYNSEGFYNMDGLKDYSIPKFMGLYLNNIFENPRSVLTALLCRTEQIWSVSNPRGSFTVIQYPYNERGDTEEKTTVAGIPERKQNILTDAFNWVFDQLKSTSGILYKFYWRGNFLYNILLCCVLTLFLTRVRGNWDVLILCLPIVFNIISLMAGGGWPDYRYHAPAIGLVPIIFIYCNYRLNAQKEHYK